LPFSSDSNRINEGIYNKSWRATTFQITNSK
jgi:hypothetical protein